MEQGCHEVVFRTAKLLYAEYCGMNKILERIHALCSEKTYSV
jgi:hypothetical protein